MLLISQKLSQGKAIREMGTLVCVVGLGMTLQSTNVHNQYDWRLVLPWLAYSCFPPWCLIILRAELGLKTSRVLLCFYFATVFTLTNFGFMFPKMAYQGMAAAEILIALSYGASIPSALLLVKVRRDQALVLIAACLCFTILLKLPQPLIAIFSHRASRPNGGPGWIFFQFVIPFWLMTIGAFGVVKFILQRMHDEVEYKAMADPLTQALNRRGLAEHIRVNATRRSPGTQAQVGVIALDIDNFKPINDHYGHAEGDLVLIEFAQRIRRVIRNEDVVARTGGEEFVVILGSTEAPRIDEISERLRKEIEGSLFLLSSGQTLAVTSSLGYSKGLASDASAVNVTMREADEALYAAKRAGKNCVRPFVISKLQSA